MTQVKSIFLDELAPSWNGEESEINKHENHIIDIPRSKDSKTNSHNSYTYEIPIRKDSKISHGS